MARYVLTKAFWSNQQRVRAGRTICQSQGEMQPGDFLWTGTLPDGAVCRPSALVGQNELIA